MKTGDHRYLPVTIINALLEDAAVILELQKLAYRSEAEICNDFTIPPLVQTLEEFKKEFGAKTILKAMLGDQLVGSIRAWEQDGTCYIERVIVHPDYQGKGIGKQLMCEVERFFAVKRFELFTGHKSERNLHFYHGLGYRDFKLQRIHSNLSFIYLEKLR